MTGKDDGKSGEISTRTKGSYGESIAEKFLIAKGYEIIKKNFTLGKTGEIDIIAKDGDYLVFVEVKARKSKEFGEPEEAINYRKQMSIRKVANGYFYINQIQNQLCRFDVVAIDYTKNPAEIRHYVNAF